jgi:hypothetical protein
MRSPLVVPAGRRLWEAVAACGRRLGRRRSPPPASGDRRRGDRVAAAHGDHLRGAVTACPTLVRRPTLVPSLPKFTTSPPRKREGRLCRPHEGCQHGFLDSTLSFGPGLPAVRSISRMKTASPSAGFSYDAFRLGVSCRLAQSRRLSDSCLKAVMMMHRR